MTDTPTDIPTETATEPAVDQDAVVPPMRFVAPEGFHALPIAATEEERDGLAREMVRELYPEGDEELWIPAAEYFSAMGGAVSGMLDYSALGFFTRADGEGVAQCSFTVMAVPSGHADPEVAARGIQALYGSDPDNAVRWMDLPCGPAVACLSNRETTFPGELTASGEPVSLQAGQIQIQVPFPTGPYIAIFTLETFAVDQWKEFCEMMVAIMRTVGFDAGDEGAAAGSGGVVVVDAGAVG